MQTVNLKVLENRFDIWRYARFLPLIPEQFWISDLRNTFTRLEKRNECLLIKHEDEHPLGSHKGRSLAYQLSQLYADGKRCLTISSSGNAAYAFLSLTSSERSYAFVSPKADPKKLAALLSIGTKGHLIVSSSPRTFATWMVHKHGFTDLRPSQSDDAIIGLMSLGFELFEQIPDLSHDYSIFSVTTSGGNVLGMYKAFDMLQKAHLLKTLPKLCPILLKEYKGGTLTDERKKDLERVVTQTRGTFISMKPVLDGKEATSFEGNTALQEYLKFRIQSLDSTRDDKKFKINKAIVIFTGRIWPDIPVPEHKIYTSVSDFAKDYHL